MAGTRRRSSVKTALLLSGGIRSTCVAWMYRPDIAFVIDFGQPAFAAEIRSASAICAELDIAMRVLSLRVGIGNTECSLARPGSTAVELWRADGERLIAASLAETRRIGATRLLIASETRDHRALIGLAESRDAVAAENGTTLAELVFPAIARSTDTLAKASQAPGHLLAQTHNCTRSNLACQDCRACDRASTALLSIGFDLGLM